MSDTGSDSDATVAEEVNEENANSDSSDDSSIHTVEVLHPDCAVSLQRRQKLLFEKITSETSGVQYGKPCVAKFYMNIQPSVDSV